MRAVIVFLALSLTLSAPPLAAKESCTPDSRTCSRDGSRTVTVSCGPCT